MIESLPWYLEDIQDELVEVSVYTRTTLVWADVELGVLYEFGLFL